MILKIASPSPSSIWFAGFIGVVGFGMGGAEVMGQVVMDGKLGVAGALSGPNYSIPATLGAVRGNNLFHSFSQFDLQQGDVAAFSGPANIQNILGRVTGGTASSIDGTLRSDIAGANLFLINPQGMVFGPNAVIDVTGSFSASTADYLKLADGTRFVASLDADDSGLSTAPVSAFGFLGNVPGSIQVQQSTLEVQTGKEISLVGGNIEIQGGTVRAPSGKILVASVQSPGEFPSGNPEPDADAFRTTFPGAGSVGLLANSTLDASGDGGGRIVIRSGQLTVDGSGISANSTGVGDGLGIDVAVQGSLELLNGGSITSRSTAGTGAGGDIVVDAGSVLLDGGGLVDDNFSPSTQITTSTGDLFNGGGQSPGGNITIRTGALELRNSSQISSASFGEGNAGNIEIEADVVRLDALLSTAAQITANTQLFFGGGNAGNISIQAGTFEMMNGATLLAVTFGSGQAGSIQIVADTIRLLSSAIVTAGTFGAGSGGNVQVQTGQLLVDGRDTLNGGVDMLTGIQAVTTSLDDPAPGGNIQVVADVVRLEHAGSLFTTTFGIGNGGNIQVQSGVMSLDSGASLRAASESTGVAGQIAVTTTGALMLGGQSAISTSALQSSGGDIVLTAGSEIRVVESQVSAQAGPGGGGNITLNAPNLIYLNKGTLTAQAEGDGGNLTIDPVFFIVNESSLISRSSTANGGNITLVSQFFLQSLVLIDASAPFGVPGAVTVTAPDLDLSGSLVRLPGNLLDAESRLGAHCGVRLGGNVSSLVVLGRGGLPLAAEGFTPSPVSIIPHEKK